MTTPWEANRAVLLRRDPALVALLEAAERPPYAQCFDARSGQPALKVRNARGEEVHLCSAYDPVAEAEALVRAVPTEGLMSYVVLGLGLGYHAEALFRKASPESLLLLFETDAGLARLALEARDLSTLLMSPRVFLVVGRESAEVFERLESHVLSLFLGFRFVRHPPSLDRDLEGFRTVMRAVQDLMDYGETALGTAMLIPYQTKQNLCMNLADYAFRPGVAALKGAWKGRPAVVIGAGPSLGRNLPLLKAVKGKVALLSVGTALKPCLRAGVVPDLATTLDYSRLSAKYLEGMEGFPSVPLVVDPKGNWQAVQGYPGPRYFIQNAYLDQMLEGLLGPPGESQLETGATVAHLTYSLARYLGADPILFVGLDLAYTHHSTHLPGTAIHDQWGPELNRFTTLELKEWEQLARMRGRLKALPAVGGGTVFTDDQMFSYLQKFQKSWRTADHKVIDATEGGALKEGAEAMPLAAALAPFAGAVGDPLPVPPAPDREALGPRLLAVLDKRLKECADISRIYRDTLKRLGRIERRFEDRPFVSKQIAAIDRERKAIKSYGLMNSLIAELTQSEEFTRIQRDKTIAARRLEGQELQKAQIARDLDYVSGLRRGAEVLGHLLAMARAGVAAYPGRVPWTDPPPPAEKEEKGEDVAVPVGPAR